MELNCQQHIAAIIDYYLMQILSGSFIHIIMFPSANLKAYAQLQEYFRLSSVFHRMRVQVQYGH